MQCKGQLKHGVPYEVMDLLSLILYQTDYTMKLGPNLEEFTCHFQCLGREDPQGCPGL